MKRIFIILCIYLYIKQIENQNISLFMHDYSFETKISKFFSRLLRRYKHFGIIFHTETKYVQYISVVMNYFTYNKTNLHESYTCYLVYNHDILTSEQMFSRPNVSHIVNFLFTKKWKLWKELAVPEKITSNDVVIFVAIGNGTVRNTVDRKGIDFVKLSGKTILLEIIPHHGVTLYETCYYCGKQSMKYKFIEKTHDSHLATKRERFMPNLFRNLNGHKFIIVYIQYFPYIYCKKSKIKIIQGKATTICIDIRGIESHMLKIVSKKLNFTFEVHIMPPEASYFDMIQFVSNYKADMAIGGISMTVDRVPFVQFTNQYNTEEFTFLYLFTINIKEIFIKFIEPFNAFSVWCLYFGFMFLVAFILHIALKTEKRRREQSIPFYESLFLTFRGCLEQSYPNISMFYCHRTSIALTLGMWWWTCIIINTIYRSTVLSTVVNPPSLEPEDMAQLLQAGYHFVANKQFQDIVNDLLKVPDPMYTETLSKIDYGTDTCDVFNKILYNQVAMLDEISTMQYEIRTACPQPEHNIIKWLRIGRKPLRSTGHAWATQRGAPYRPAIDFYINWIINGGHFKKWTHDITMKLRKTMIDKSREAANKKFRTFPIRRLYPLLAVYLCGNIFATIIFLCEILYYKAFRSN